MAVFRHGNAVYWQPPWRAGANGDVNPTYIGFVPTYWMNHLEILSKPVAGHAAGRHHKG